MADTAAASKPAGLISRKKFATPPVKVACLSCRASRTRCNGQQPCATCGLKDRECVYKPSRRGGPRTRRVAHGETDGGVMPSAAEEVIAPQPPLSVDDYIAPGAGLQQLGDSWSDSDVLFDQLFCSPVDDTNAIIAIPMVRTYNNDAAILNAYYIWIHPYFPILPPPISDISPDLAEPILEDQGTEFEEPSSPIALAICAILALIPCPQDPKPLDVESIRYRRKYAQFLATSAVESIEIENENPESSVEPSKALEETSHDLGRQQFHPHVPIELEAIIALDILSVYEYAQRGNLKKMRDRSSSALMAAMQLGLHLDTEAGEHVEARRRVWWMTYVCVCQSSIVSNTAPMFEVFAPSFTTRHPTIKADPEAWTLYIQAQQAILAATQFVIAFNKARKSKADLTPIYARMQELEGFLEPLITISDAWLLESDLCKPVDGNEQLLSQSLRCMARIKLNSARIKVHRFGAFFDTPVFSRKHCDLRPTLDPDQELRQWTCCSGMGNDTFSHSEQSMSPIMSSPSTLNYDVGYQEQQCPFSSHQSARICFKSALNIAQGFDYLPYPNPFADGQIATCYLESSSNLRAPRTMPSFACCAMNCAYVLLMIKDKTTVMYSNPEGNTELLVNGLLGRLQQGLLSIFTTLENYGTAFEALGGMRDQIRDKIHPPRAYDAL